MSSMLGPGGTQNNSTYDKDIWWIEDHKTIVFVFVVLVVFALMYATGHVPAFMSPSSGPPPPPSPPPPPPPAAQ
jgi:hypothetical protein